MLNLVDVERRVKALECGGVGDGDLVARVEALEAKVSALEAFIGGVDGVDGVDGVGADMGDDAISVEAPKKAKKRR